MSAQHPLVGRTVAGRYRVKRLLGEGGMATVFVAEQEGEPREIALKIMNEELTRERSFVKRFEREAKSAALVVHANSVRILGWGVADGISYIAMELVEGDDLFALLERGGPITQLRAARILAEVCDALEVAHKLGIVHRDLKPENIMVVRDPSFPGGERIKVLDFGIAKLVAPDLVAAPNKRPRYDSDPGSALTQAGTLIGTPAYMSPEQCKLENVDARSDIYTCGVLLFQLITGRLPFSGETPLHTAMLHIHEAVQPPKELAPDLDGRLEAVMLRALEKEPAERYQTAGDLAKALRALVPMLADTAAAAEGKKKPISSRERAPSLPVTPRRFPETLRWAGEVAPPVGLESQRTLRTDRKSSAPAPPMSAQAPRAAPLANEPVSSEPPTERPAPASQVPSSDDPMDLARTLVREPDDSQVMSAPSPSRRSGPQGTAVMHMPSTGIEPPRRREIKSTLRSANDFQPSSVHEGVQIRIADGTASTFNAEMDTQPASQQMPPSGPPSHLATLPMKRATDDPSTSFNRAQLPIGRGVGHTLPVSVQSPAHALRQQGSTLELVNRPRVVEPFPIGRKASAPGGFSQMSGARVLLLGFLAGAVLMAIAGVTYFFAIAR